MYGPFTGTAYEGFSVIFRVLVNDDLLNQNTSSQKTMEEVALWAECCNLESLQGHLHT